MGREKVVVKTKSPALAGCPEKRGVCIRVYTQTPEETEFGVAQSGARAVDEFD